MNELMAANFRVISVMPPRYGTTPAMVTDLRWRGPAIEICVVLSGGNIYIKILNCYSVWLFPQVFTRLRLNSFVAE